MAWAPLCMDPEDWRRWQSANRSITAQSERIERPCQECPLGFAAEMRAAGRCNGTPSGVDEEEDQMSQVSRINSKPVQVRLVAPCEKCVHRDVCSIRESLTGALAEGVEVEMPALRPELTPVATIAVECSRFRRETGAGRPPMTAEQRAAAGDRLARGRELRANQSRAQAT